MTNLDVLSAWLDGIRHVRKKGHWPDWIELGDHGPGFKTRECVNCLYGKGGSGRQRIARPVRRFALQGVPV